MRQHKHSIELAATPEKCFAILHTPSAIRGWWSATRAIVIPRQGGIWAATWGENEDDPDYISAARIAVFDPPRRLVLSDANYLAKSGPLPFEPNFTTEFQVEAAPGGCVLRVIQSGFPDDPVADAFYAACEVGWRNTFEGIRRYLGS